MHTFRFLRSRLQGIELVGRCSCRRFVTAGTEATVRACAAKHIAEAR